LFLFSILCPLSVMRLSAFSIKTFDKESFASQVGNCRIFLFRIDAVLLVERISSTSAIKASLSRYFFAKPTDVSQHLVEVLLLEHKRWPNIVFSQGLTVVGQGFVSHLIYLHDFSRNFLN